ncbi:glycosyltransferase family 2 protein, partial [Patescibacteria group bacterium AH-259-L07]|nr:glycosyltransferase family 2 protein [Patescibacteria group bacterium AH-259-L07]
MIQYLFRTTLSIARLYVIYKPFKTFVYLSLIFFIPGFILGARFVLFFIYGQGQGHLQSLIAAAILIITSVIM